jgi:hypothetical protein
VTQLHVVQVDKHHRVLWAVADGVIYVHHAAGHHSAWGRSEDIENHRIFCPQHGRHKHYDKSHDDDEDFHHVRHHQTDLRLLSSASVFLFFVLKSSLKIEDEKIGKHRLGEDGDAQISDIKATTS